MKKLVVAALASLAALGLPAGVAQANDADVIREGSCSANSDWKLKLSPENGRIEIEFEVDQNVVGQVWDVVIRDNGNVVFTGQRTTVAPSGSFEVRRVVTNLAGDDRVVARATNVQTGEVCRGVATATF
ncbi:MAG: hypothetical protein M3313_06370 [Actinomycetota bacterium]|nr:hypothetical protein [Actinomycetota bacterium]